MGGITEIRLQCSRTINLGNFESLRIEAGVTVAVDDPNASGISPNEYERYYLAVKEAAQKELRSLLEETYRSQTRKGKSDDQRSDAEASSAGNGRRPDALAHRPGDLLGET